MTYHEWLERFASLTPETRTKLRRKILVLDHPPLISVILPVYNSDLKFLERAIASVRRQIYANWEVCVADDASTDLRIKPFLENLSCEDRRIKVLFRDKNGHISACSNSALSLARGDWCALLDQDDELAEDALAEVACEITRNPDAAIVYSDEDFLDANDVRSNPFFKPDWNPELFLAQNYLNHLGAYRTSLLQEIGGFREGFEGSQDYDLALRCVARARSEQIRHIPRILYHWRMVRGSLADQPDAKPYARHAARRALNSYLQARGIAAHAEACPQNAESHRVVYQLPAVRPTVTIFRRTVNRLVATCDDTGGKRSVASANESKGSERSRGIRGTDSAVPSPPGLADYPVLEVIALDPGAAAANRAAQKAQGEILLFLSDAICAAEEGWLPEIVSHVVSPEVGAVGARLWSPEGDVEDGGLILGLGGIAAPPFRGLPREHPGYFNRAWLQQNFSAVSGACLAVRRSVFAEAGGFDAGNLPHHFYDVDFCLRLGEKKLRIVWTPYADLTLSDSGPEENADASQEAGYMKNRWGERLRRDPSYNPNLSLDPPGFTLAIPPRI